VCNIYDATLKIIAVAKVKANIVIHICSSIAWQAGARPVSQPPAPGLSSSRWTIATPDNAGALAAKAASDVIPIVFQIGNDPVKLGLVASLNRPGGNATGVSYFTFELGPKRLGLLMELMPSGVNVVVLADPSSPIADSALKDMQAAASAVARRARCYCLAYVVRAASSGASVMARKAGVNEQAVFASFALNSDAMSARLARSTLRLASRNP